jgi:hypothetical protein
MFQRQEREFNESQACGRQQGSARNRRKSCGTKRSMLVSAVTTPSRAATRESAENRKTHAKCECRLISAASAPKDACLDA